MRAPLRASMTAPVNDVPNLVVVTRAVSFLMIRWSAADVGYAVASAGTAPTVALDRLVAAGEAVAVGAARAVARRAAARAEEVTTRRGRGDMAGSLMGW